MEGVKQNYEATAQVLKHNCDKHTHAESCYKLGAYHVTGKGTNDLSIYICGNAHLIIQSIAQEKKSGKTQ